MLMGKITIITCLANQKEMKYFQIYKSALLYHRGIVDRERGICWRKPNSRTSFLKMKETWSEILLFLRLKSVPDEIMERKLLANNSANNSDSGRVWYCWILYDIFECSRLFILNAQGYFWMLTVPCDGTIWKAVSSVARQQDPGTWTFATVGIKGITYPHCIGFWGKKCNLEY